MIATEKVRVMFCVNLTNSHFLANFKYFHFSLVLCRIRRSATAAMRSRVNHIPPFGTEGSLGTLPEILELLALRGDVKFQEALKSSHRNFVHFEALSRNMALYGHCHTALECRTKAKVPSF